LFWVVPYAKQEKMTTDSPSRRPSRAARSSKKYTVDPFEQYRELLEQESGDERPVMRDDKDAGSDDEFDEAQAAQELADAAAEDEEDEADSGDASSDDSSGEDVPARPIKAVKTASRQVEDDDPIIAVTPKVKLPPARRPMPTKKTPGKKRNETTSYNEIPIFDPAGNLGAKGRAIHFSRGVSESVQVLSREGRVIYAMGPGEEDLIAHVQVRDQWIDDATVPCRKQTKGRLGGGLAYSPFYPEEKRRREVDEEMAWYYAKGGRELFKKGQVFTKVDKDFTPSHYTRSEDIVSGPINAQKLFDGRDFTDSWDLSEAYADTLKAKDQQAWVFNAGARIQALEWCPNGFGTTQYLAISTSRSPSDAPTNGDVLAPAFTSLERQQQALQIWEVTALVGEKTASGIDFTKRPRLLQVFSTDWGHLKKMRWCPVPDKEEPVRDRLGLLGTVFSDGSLRVFDMPLPKGDSEEVEYIHIEQAAFESRPPESLCTCLTWLSSKSIAAGTADGCGAVWNLPDCLKEAHPPKASAGSNESSGSNNHNPWLYQRFHQSYIQSITSGYPSRPHLLITYSFDGFMRMTDLRSPSYDTVATQRSRIAQGTVVWHDTTQSALNIDDNFTLKSYGARMFYKAVSVARLTAFGADVSVSPLHASVLVACVDGSVWVTNPLRRLREHKYKPLVQCVLKHEWRRPVQSPKTTTATNGLKNAGAEDEDGDVEMEDTNPILKKPLIRIMTGYKIQFSEMGQENRANATKDFVSFATVHEEKTAATQVAWNPNMIAGTWGAFGMGSGLVIVKDLAAQ
jgi:transcription factor C subunit 6